MRTNQILFKVIPFVFAVVLLKLITHALGYEVISLNAIFSGIIGANVFLLGFLLSGVLSDFKESEKLPGDMASSLHTIADELELVCRQKENIAARSNLAALHKTSQMIKKWFYKETKTIDLMLQLHDLYLGLGSLDGVVLPNYLARLKQEHGALRRMIIRVHTIRETSFVSSGYLIATTTTFFLLTGLVIAKIEPFYESLFFVGLIAYLMVFLILLIRDLDNPFGYYSQASSEDVSLKPLEDLIADLSKWAVIHNEQNRVA
jgi:predicted membrane chloride channel (bestrophin family)